MPHGPLPQWDQIGSFRDCAYEAQDPSGVIWRLWLVRQPDADDRLPPGYRLAPRSNLTDHSFISAQHGLRYALDQAGMKIADRAVQADPEGAQRQLGFGVADEA